MDKKINIYSKLQKVQSELKAPKGQFNSFGKYNYRSCEDILEALKPLLTKNDLILTITDKVELIGDRYYLVATAKLTDTEDGQCIEVQSMAREDESKKGMDLAQVTGSVSSYARKYALNGLFCIDDTKDSDATNTHDKTENKTTVSKTLDKDKIDTLNNLAELKKVDVPKMLGYYKVTKAEDMTLQQWQHAMNYLKGK